MHTLAAIVKEWNAIFAPWRTWRWPGHRVRLALFTEHCYGWSWLAILLQPDAEFRIGHHGWPWLQMSTYYECHKTMMQLCYRHETEVRALLAEDEASDDDEYVDTTPKAEWPWTFLQHSFK